MKLTSALFSGLLTLTITSAAQAGSFYENFDTYTPDTELHGVGGWSVNAPNLPSALPNAPAGLASSTNFGSGSDVWGTLGGRFSYPNTATVELTHSAAVPLFGTQFKVDVAIFPSVVTPFDPIGSPGATNRDSFGWSLKDSGGSDLVRFAFEPTAIDPNKMELVWYQGATRTQSGWDINYSGLYTLTASFSGVSGSDLAFNASINGSLFAGVLTGAASANVATVNADFDVTSSGPLAGNNFMAFNNLEVPEPSSMLTAGLALLGMTFRRRR